MLSMSVCTMTMMSLKSWLHNDENENYRNHAIMMMVYSCGQSIVISLLSCRKYEGIWHNLYQIWVYTENYRNKCNGWNVEVLRKSCITDNKDIISNLSGKLFTAILQNPVPQINFYFELFCNSAQSYSWNYGNYS